MTDDTEDPVFSQNFDVLIYGTGLVEAIVAAGLARQGKSVVHIDHQPFYGRDWANLSLREFGIWLKCQSKDVNTAQAHHQHDNLSERQQVADRLGVPVDQLSVLDFNNIDASYQGNENSSNTLLNSEMIGKDLGVLAVEYDEIPEELWAQQNKFTLDLCPRLILSRGEMVDLLVNSGIHEYCEFKAFDGSYALFQESASMSQPRLCKVPSAKPDIFRNDVLSLAEKRQLMRFLQFMVDEIQQREGHEDLSQLNEQYLARGRSLARPQNKRVDSTSCTSLISNTDDSLDRLFAKFGFSDRLATLVLHALAFCADNPRSKTTMTSRGRLCASTAVDVLAQTIRAMGRYGGTGFIVPRYGCGDLPQAFCRHCAVKGGIYILRMPLARAYTRRNCVTTESSTLSSAKKHPNYVVVNSDGKMVSCDAIISPAELIDISTHSAESKAPNDTIVSVSPSDAVAFGLMITKTSLLDFLLDNKIDESHDGRSTVTISSRSAGDMTLSATGKERATLVVPPNTPPFSNPTTMFVHQQDSTCGVSPNGYYVIHIISALEEPTEPAASNVFEAMRRFKQHLSINHENAIMWFAATARVTQYQGTHWKFGEKFMFSNTTNAVSSSPPPDAASVNNSWKSRSSLPFCDPSVETARHLYSQFMPGNSFFQSIDINESCPSEDKQPYENHPTAEAAQAAGDQLDELDDIPSDFEDI